MNSNSMAIAYPPPWPQVGNAYESYAWALPRAGTNQLLFEHSLSDSPGGMARQEYRTFLLQYRRSVEHVSQLRLCLPPRRAYCALLYHIVLSLAVDTSMQTKISFLFSNVNITPSTSQEVTRMRSNSHVHMNSTLLYNSRLQ